MILNSIKNYIKTYPIVFILIFLIVVSIATFGNLKFNFLHWFAHHDTFEEHENKVFNEVKLNDSLVDFIQKHIDSSKVQLDSLKVVKKSLSEKHEKLKAKGLHINEKADTITTLDSLGNLVF